MNFFITNREIEERAHGVEAIRENGREHAGDNLRFGTYEIASRTFTLFPEPTSATDTFYGSLAARPADELAGSARFFKTLYDELRRPDALRNDVLFFIHGFNTDLDGVRAAFERLHRCYVQPPSSPVAHLVVFTWPGRSPKVPYHYFDDRKDAIRSGEAFARGMEKVIRFFREFLSDGQNEPCGRNIHLMVHSMGTRVLKHMMLKLRACRTPLPELFGEILLMAADIEFDIFEPGRPFDSLISLGRRVHVYFHERDRVLDISKYTKNFSNRLGRYGRKKIDPTQVDVLDANVTGVQDDLDPNLGSDALNHWYYYSSSEVVNDVIRVMTDGNESRFVVKS
jgi:esterase/lipase superfamily enzyme